MALPLLGVWGCILGCSLCLLRPCARSGNGTHSREKFVSLHILERQMLCETEKLQQGLHETGQLMGQFDLWVKG